MVCKKCKGTELIPLVKDGKVIPYAFINCECHEDEPEHYYPLTPEDFDFPCSYAFRSYFEEQCTGNPLPQLYPKEIPERVEPELPRPWDKVQQLESEVVGWRQKHAILSKEIDLLKAKVNRSLKSTYTIK